MMNYMGIAGWLSRWTGVEVLHERLLDQLTDMGVRYSQVENALIAGDRRVGDVTMTSDEIYVLLKQRGVKGALFEDFKRGVMTLVLARKLCLLMELGDPAFLTHGNFAQYNTYVAAIEEKGKPH